MVRVTACAANQRLAPSNQDILENLEESAGSTGSEDPPRDPTRTLRIAPTIARPPANAEVREPAHDLVDRGLLSRPPATRSQRPTDSVPANAHCVVPLEHVRPAAVDPDTRIATSHVRVEWPARTAVHAARFRPRSCAEWRASSRLRRPPRSAQRDSPADQAAARALLVRRLRVAQNSAVRPVAFAAESDVPASSAPPALQRVASPAIALEHKPQNSRTTSSIAQAFAWPYDSKSRHTFPRKSSEESRSR